MRHLRSTPWRRTLYIMFIAQLVSSVGFSSMFPFLPLYVHELGSPNGWNLEFLGGMAYSAQAMTMMIASPLWGVLADRAGRKLMMERATFGGTLILLLMAFAPSAEVLVLLRAVQGLITGTGAAANALVASIAPREESGYAMGLLQMGSGTGVALGPVLGGFLADLYGYNAAFYVTAAMLFLSGLLVLFGVQENFTPPEHQPVRGPGALLSGWRAIFATPGVGTTFGLRFISQLGRYLLIPVAPLFIASLIPSGQGLNTFTGLVTGAAAATMTLSATSLGRLGDRVGHRRVLLISALAAGALFIPQAAVQSPVQLLILQALTGVALGGVIPTISALLAQYTRLGGEGTVYGLDNSIDAAARSVAPLLGSGIAVFLGLRLAFGASAIFFLACAALTALLPQVKKGQTHPAAL